MTENYSSPKYPLDESIFAAKYATYQEIVQILKNWAHKNCFGLVIDKHDKDKRVYLRCKRGGDTRIRVVNEDRQRSKNTIRVQCPYIIKIVYSKKAAENEKWRLCKQDEDLNEDKHNHPLDMDQALVLPLAKRSLLGSETIAIVQHQMIDAGNTVPEIRKTISGTDGETIMNYHDIRNWKVEVQAHDKLKPRDVDSDVFKFIKSIEEKGYIVRYQTSTDGKHLQSIFFMHCTAVDEVNIRGEVFAIDATYKVNELEMPLVSIQSVSHLGRKSLMTTPIAYAIVSNESSSTYAWILNNIKEIAPNGNTNVFITDKHSGVMKGLSAVHPDKVHLLCTWHMLESVKVALKGLFISSKSTHACMKAVSDMIDSSTEEDFQSALDAYQNEATDVKKLTEKNKVMQQNGKIVQKYLAQEYLSDYWLVIKKKWAGYIVKKTVNFGCNTTQRVEGSHASLKMNAVSSRSTLPNLFNEIDKYIKKQIMRQTNAMRDEKIKVDCFIQGNSFMSLLTGKISSWALDRIYQELLKTVAEDEEPFLPVEKCFDCEIKSFNLPCKHEVAHPASKLHGKIRLEIVGRRWLLK